MVDVTFLTRELERDLAIRWRDNRDEKARDILILAYQPLVAKICKKYRRYGVADEDMRQEGIFGLIRACETFDPDRDMRFSTYARWWIRSVLQEYVLRNSSIVGYLRSNRGRLEFFRNNCRVPCVSFDAPITAEGASLADVLESEEASPEAAAEASVDTGRVNAQLHAALELLDPRSRQIIQERWLNDDSDTLEVAARKFGISRERVRQIEGKAMALIKTVLEGGTVVPRRRGVHVVMVPAE